MKVALVYDRVNKWGGAERVLLALHEMFPDAPIFTSVYNKNSAGWAADLDIRPSFLQSIPFFRSHHELIAPLMPIAFESFNFDKFDVVISVTSEAAKGIITKSGTMHICLCLTPTRYLWSGYKEYFKNIFSRFFIFPFLLYLKYWDATAASRPDYFISISEIVQQRVSKYYTRESDVIYPPLTLGQKLETRNSKLEINPTAKNSKLKRGDYYLVVSRLSRFTMYKRVDLAIKASNILKIPLKIIGEGRDIDYFREMAGSTIEFLGWVTDTELEKYYANAKALIFPGVEDFGLVMVEALSCGTPVIAYGVGGALEIVDEGKNGEFFDRQSVRSLVECIKYFQTKRYRRQICVNSALRFSEDVFCKHIKKFVDKKVVEYFKK